MSSVKFKFLKIGSCIFTGKLSVFLPRERDLRWEHGNDGVLDLLELGGEVGEVQEELPRRRFHVLFLFFFFRLLRLQHENLGVGDVLVNLVGLGSRVDLRREKMLLKRIYNLDGTLFALPSDTLPR